METVISPLTNRAYFKSHKRLYFAPINDENNIDFERAEKVDYFWLTSEDFEEAMAILSIFDEREGIDNEIQ